MAENRRNKGFGGKRVRLFAGLEELLYSIKPTTSHTPVPIGVDPQLTPNLPHLFPASNTATLRIHIIVPYPNGTARHFNTSVRTRSGLYRCLNHTIVQYLVENVTVSHFHSLKSHYIKSIVDKLMCEAYFTAKITLKWKLRTSANTFFSVEKRSELHNRIWPNWLESE
jgi:hypothetical protein